MWTKLKDTLQSCKKGFYFNELCCVVWMWVYTYYYRLFFIFGDVRFSFKEVFKYVIIFWRLDSSLHSSWIWNFMHFWMISVINTSYTELLQNNIAFWANNQGYQQSIRKTIEEIFDLRSQNWNPTGECVCFITGSAN